MQSFFCTCMPEITRALKFFVFGSAQYRFPICHSSLVSISNAEINLKHEASLGNKPTTPVRLQISLLIRSKLFVVRIVLRCFKG